MKNEWLPTAENYKKMVDRALEGYFRLPESDPMHGFAEAARYSLLAGGKRVRAMLVLEFCRISGGRPEDALDVACGVEMLHAYSLIHDDLPCMDNDDLRRGKPTNHIVYGECVATLAGDVLQAEAFRSVLHAGVSESARLRCARLLADAVGMDGMCGGQYLDMIGEGKTLSADELDDINLRKTTAAADGSREQEKAALQFGRLIGLAFQIRDDMLDVLSTSDELGKPVGSDREENKNTYMALLGPDACSREIRRLTDEAVALLRGCFPGHGLSRGFCRKASRTEELKI